MSRSLGREPGFTPFASHHSRKVRHRGRGTLKCTVLKHTVFGEPQLDRIAVCLDFAEQGRHVCAHRILVRALRFKGQA